jgi:hypothetical protein
MFVTTTAASLSQTSGSKVLTVYEHINKGGKSKTYYEKNATYSNRANTLGIANDTISSIVVHQPVRVTLYEHDHTNLGKYMWFPMGSYNLTDYGFNDVTSKIEITPFDAPNVILFQDIYENWGWSSKASALALTVRSRSDLREVQWNDIASSVYVPYGKSIILYQHIHYSGKSLVLHTGVHNLTKYMMEKNISWNDQVSSYKVI